MKNLYYQSIKQAAKHFHSRQHGDCFEKGIKPIYTYRNEEATKLSWWDDVTFILNNYRVHVSWSHPRWHYKEAIRSKAFDNVYVSDAFDEDAFKNASPQFVRVGNSRKKVASYTMDSLLKSGMFELLETEEKKLLETNDFKIYPSMTVNWFKDCRYIDICAPIEIKCTQDLITLVTLVKCLLNSTTTLRKEFPDYSYSQKRWEEDYQV